MKYLFESMKNVYTFPIDGINLTDAKEVSKIDNQIEINIKAIVEKLKSSGEKFVDTDFGPTDSDEFGASSLYGSSKPAPAGSKYPSPESLRWTRPQYYDTNFSHSEDKEELEEEEDEFADNFGAEDDEDKCFAKHGSLFLDGSSSGDVVQGQLGDCWFLSALAVMGAQEKLLQDCFWRMDTFKEFGLFVLRFFKDCHLMYVVIDDRIPVNEKNGKVVFAQCKDPNELWVPLIEKAYAKLHGCYKALIGGFTHYGLGDMTGFSPRLIVLKPGFAGYSEPHTEESVWNMLINYKNWNSLLGCSIQSNPKSQSKVEEEAGGGLHTGHAYSLLDIGEIEIENGKKQKLVKCRNPWGRGEWDGSFSDRSDEREKYDEVIMKTFNKVGGDEQIEVNFMDGTFFIPFEEWFKRFTSLFVAVNFPSTWTSQRTQGVWSGEVGGNRSMGTWINNPKIVFKLDAVDGKKFQKVFVGLYIKDSRLTMGFDYYKDDLYSTPLSFDIVTKNEFDKQAKERSKVPYSKNEGKQPPYNFGSTQIEIELECGIEYYIVPSLYKRNQPGTYFVNVFAECSFSLDGAVSTIGGQDAMIIGSKNEIDKANFEDSKTLLMSKSQFYEKKEQLREKLTNEAKRLNISLDTLRSVFTDMNSDLGLKFSEFKRRLMGLGFSLADLADDDLIVLDEDNSGTVSPDEFIDFVKDGLDFIDPKGLPPPPEEPVDDLLYKATDLAGEIHAHVYCARELRQSVTWFQPAPTLPDINGNDEKKSTSSQEENILNSRPVINYNKITAEAVHNQLISTYEKVQTSKLAIKNNDALNLENISSNLDSTQLLDTSDKVGQLRQSTEINSISKHKMKSPSKGGSEYDFNDDAQTVRSMGVMTVSKKESIDKAGKEAAIRLHTDSLLIKAEIKRTSALSKLRESREKIGEMEARAKKLDENTVLRNKMKTKSFTKRDITKDRNVMKLLNYWPNFKQCNISVRNKFDIKTDENIKHQSYNIASVDETSIDNTKQVDLEINPNVHDDNTTIQQVNRESVSALEDLNLPSNDLSSGNDINQPHDLSHNLVDNLSNMLQLPGHVEETDLWDYLVDIVVTIVDSRMKLSSNSDISSFLPVSGKRFIRADQFDDLSGTQTPLPKPNTGNVVRKQSTGTAPTPRTIRKTPGTASVTTAAQQASKHHGKNFREETKEKLNKIAEEDLNSYEEVYRRLVLVPSTTYNMIDGDRSINDLLFAGSDLTTNLKNVFKKFDSNSDGFISLDEFRDALIDMQIETTNEESQTLFNRFETNEKDGNIDTQEFINFFNDRLYDSKNYKNLVSVITDIKFELHKYSNMDRVSNSDGSVVLPEYLIFHHLSATYASRNATLLRSIGISITEEEMTRISRIFHWDIPAYMEFMQSPIRGIDKAIDLANSQIEKCMEQRAGKVQSGNNNTDQKFNITSQSILKLWDSLSISEDGTVLYDVAVQYFKTIVEDSLYSIDENKKKSKNELTIHTHKVDILCRIIVDLILYSQWNKPPHRLLTKGVNGTCNLIKSLSISGFESYIMSRHIMKLEDKLKFVVKSKINSSLGSMYLLMHVYFSVSQKNVIVLGHDPISGKIFKIKFNQDVSNMPMGEKLSDMFFKHNEINQFCKKISHLKVTDSNKLSSNETDNEKKSEQLLQPLLYNPDSRYLFNPWDTPVEDNAITEMISRIRLVRGFSTPSTLIIAEDMKFVNQMKEIIDKAPNLPFFTVVNDLTLCFEVDDASLVGSQHISQFVFGHIRKYKALHSFLTNVVSSMTVVLTTYNSSVRLSMKWTSMLAHLNDYKNPFVQLQLLPKFLKPEEYIYNPQDNAVAFTGEEEDDPSEAQFGKPDMDGGTHPTWDNRFKFNYKPPKLTTCKVLSTEIVKMKIDGSYKYAIIMVREGRKEVQEFKFLTLYDSRSSTEYQCGVKRGCKLALDLYGSEQGKASVPRSVQEVDCNDESDDPIELKGFDLFMKHLGEASDRGWLLLGPAITPRLIVSVYNRRGKEDELLGSSQMSISSVLSGTGIGKKQWVTLAYNRDKGDGSSINVQAGDVQIELEFLKKADIEAAAQSERDRKVRIEYSKVSNSVSNTFLKLKDKVSNFNEFSSKGFANLSNSTSLSKIIPLVNDPLENKELNDLKQKLEALKIENEELKSKSLETVKSPEVIELSPLEKESEELNDLKQKLEYLKIENEELKSNSKSLETINSAEVVISNSINNNNDEFNGDKIIDNSKQYIDEINNVKDSFEKLKIEKEEILLKYNELENSFNSNNNNNNNNNNENSIDIHEYNKLQKEHEELKIQSEHLRLSYNESINKKETQETTSKITLNTTNNSIGTEIFDGSAQSLVQIFVSRHEKKIMANSNGGYTKPQGSPIDGFIRLLGSYATKDNYIRSSDLKNTLEELMIDVSMEQADKLMDNFHNNTVKGVSDYFKDRFKEIFKKDERRKSTMRSVSPDLKRNSFKEVITKKETNKTTSNTLPLPPDQSLNIPLLTVPNPPQSKPTSSGEIDWNIYPLPNELLPNGDIRWERLLAGEKDLEGNIIQKTYYSDNLKEKNQYRHPLNLKASRSTASQSNNNTQNSNNRKEKNQIKENTI
jgi:Ca2+-binding EF-hand superfamily protein